MMNKILGTVLYVGNSVNNAIWKGISTVRTSLQERNERKRLEKVACRRAVAEEWGNEAKSSIRGYGSSSPKIITPDLKVYLLSSEIQKIESKFYLPYLTYKDYYKRCGHIIDCEHIDQIADYYVETEYAECPPRIVRNGCGNIYIPTIIHPGYTDYVTEQEYRKQEMLAMYDDTLQSYIIGVIPGIDVPESDIFVGLHWVNSDNTYGGWVCDKSPTYVGNGKFEATFSMLEVIESGLTRESGIKLYPVVYYSADGKYKHATFKTTLEDAVAADLFVEPDAKQIDLARIKKANPDEKSAKETMDSFYKKSEKAGVPIDSTICIDGSNIICINNELKTRTLKAIVEALQDNGYNCKVFLDASMFGRLKYKECDEEGLRYLKEGERDGLIVVAPGKAEADGQILQYAEYEDNIHIITNDRYRDYADLHSWLNDPDVADRIHGVNVVSLEDGRYRILIAGFNLDITV